MLEAVLEKRKLNIKTKITIKSLISLGLIALSVGLPQLVHLFAGASGGITWMPMYLPVLVGGCLLGTWWGIGVGVMSPVISFLITYAFGNPMPALTRLPFMIVELMVFACVCGLFSKSISKNVWLAFPAVLTAQIIGRAVFIAMVAIFSSVSPLNVSVVWSQIQTGLIGLISQAVIVPLIIVSLNKILKKENSNE